MEIFSREWDTAEGRETTHISAEVRADGSLRISGQDTGPKVERFWGHDDYEYWMTIRAKDVPRFAQIALRLAFNRDKPAKFSDLRALAEAEGIEVGFQTWP